LLTKANAIRIGIALALIIGILLRFNFVLLPMNDEVLYIAASMEKYSDFAPTKELNAEHPPLAKMFFGMACVMAPCDSHVLQFHYRKYYPLAVPLMSVAAELVPVMEAMRLIALLFSLLLAIVIYYYARKEYGKEAAAVLFAMTMISPNLILYSNVVMLDMIMLFFFTTTLFYYIYTYRRNRSMKHLAALMSLLILTLGTKQYLPLLLLPIIAAIELTEYRKRKETDWRLAGGLAAGVFIFFLIIYPFELFYYHLFNHYQGSTLLSAGINLSLLPTLLARIELPLLVLLGLTAHAAYKEKAFRPEETFLLLAAGIIAFASLKFPPELSSFRYVLTFYPPLILVCGKGLQEMNAQKMKGVMALLGLSFIVVMAHYPYYDDFKGPLGYAWRHEPVERTPYFDVLAYINDHHPEERVLTTDFYALPYTEKRLANFLDYFRAKDYLNESNWIAEDEETGQISFRTKFQDSFCTDPQIAYAHLKQDGMRIVVYRIKNDASLFSCPALEFVLQRMEVEYSNTHFAVFRID